MILLQSQCLQLPVDVVCRLQHSSIADFPFQSALCENWDLVRSWHINVESSTWDFFVNLKQLRWQSSFGSIPTVQMNNMCKWLKPSKLVDHMLYVIVSISPQSSGSVFDHVELFHYPMISQRFPVWFSAHSFVVFNPVFLILLHHLTGEDLFPVNF